MDTVSIYKGGKTSRINSKWLPRFKADGWSAEGEEVAIEVPEANKSVSIGDLIRLIESSEHKDDIEAIVLDAKGIDIDKRGGLDAVRKKAIAALTGESDEG